MAARADARKLLIKIARCENARLASEDESHACRRVVAAQSGLGRTGHQLPEPWSGCIETAPLLFVGSNPSFNPHETFPVEEWPDDEIVAYFTTPDRLDLNVRYWNVVRSIAGALLGREPRPGHDYALTELVRCKSWNEKGVPQALGTCTERYLEKTLEVAGAKVVIALGKVAREGIASHIGCRSEIGLRRGTFNIGGRKRAVLMLGHPSSGQRQTPMDAEVKKLRPVLPPR
jgi:uracil-DNA glycosylase